MNISANVCIKLYKKNDTVMVDPPVFCHVAKLHVYVTIPIHSSLGFGWQQGKINHINFMI